MARITRKKITKVQQLLDIKKKYRIYDEKIEKDGISWKLKAKPSPNSRVYEIYFEYKKDCYPSVYLKNQGIMKANDDIIPHCWKRKYKTEENEKVKLCLFYTKNKEWTSDMYISDTIIPWAIEWLYYYEIWRITGKWLGKGIHETKKEE